MRHGHTVEEMHQLTPESLLDAFLMETAGQPPSAAEGEWFKKAMDAVQQADMQ